jgi:hypothetical protein
MSNHVHMVAIPHRPDSLANAFKLLHGRYASYWNASHAKSGHAWQGRFYSCAMDEAHLWEALRYAELNPVRAGMVEASESWKWSSAAAHCGTVHPDPLSDNGGLEQSLVAHKVARVSECGSNRHATRGDPAVHAHRTTARIRRVCYVVGKGNIAPACAAQRRTAWFTYFRIYGPQKGAFDGSWTPSGFELMKGRNLRTDATFPEILWSFSKSLRLRSCPWLFSRRGSGVTGNFAVRDRTRSQSQRQAASRHPRSTPYRNDSPSGRGGEE